MICVPRRSIRSDGPGVFDRSLDLSLLAESCLLRYDGAASEVFPNDEPPMVLGPIFRWEMVAAARRRRYFALRALYGALILFVLWSTYEGTRAFRRAGGETMSLQSSTMLATAFFGGFSWLQMMGILAVGPAVAVGTIAAERERRTIEYLFATDLADHEIVLGKTIARLMLLGKLVLVGLPILFLFRLLGGIPANLLLCTFLLAGSTAVMVVAVSVCVSVWSIRARDATVRVYVVLAAFLVLPAMVSAFGTQVFSATPWWHGVILPAVNGLLVVNPVWVLGRAISSPQAMGLGLNVGALLISIGWQLAVSAGALAWATFAVRRVHLGAVSRAEKSQRRAQYRPRRGQALADHPMLWKEMITGTARTRLGVVGAVAIALILAAIYGVTIYNFRQALSDNRWNRPADFFIYLAVLTGVVGSGMLLLLGARAAALVTMEKERDTWTSLLATPLTGREIMLGKMCGNLYVVRWSLAVLFSIWLLGAWIDPTFFWGALAMGLTFALTAWYVTNLGLGFSLHSQSTVRAMAATVGTLVFTSGGYLFCCCAVATAFHGREELLVLTPCIPFLLAFPCVASYEFFRGNSLVREAEFITAYALGIALYLIVAVGLCAYIVTAFDRAVGRSGRAAGE